MKLFSTIMSIPKSGFKTFLSFSIKKKIICIVILTVVLGGGGYFISKNSNKKSVTYQTSTVEKGTLISSISGTGTITTGTTTSITTGATGTVTTVYVKNGDTVSEGDKIADITLDQYGLKRQAAAWLSYTNAQEDLKTAQKNKSAADVSMWEARQSITDAEDDVDYKNNHTINPDTKEDYTIAEKTIIDKTLEKAHLAFSEAETKYKNADAEIQNASVRITSAWHDYQQVSATITAPASGVIQNLTLAPGIVISNSSDSSISISDGTTTSSSNNSNTLTASSQSVGFVKNKEGQFKATVSLSEVDIPSIKSDQKVTLTMDAFPDNTFTGKVLAVDTNGTTSSGVTTYSVTILLDATTVDIYPKMAVSAKIITLVKTDVLLIPSTAVQTTGESSTVEVMKNGKVSTVSIEVGDSNDSETEIVSGLSAGDVVVTGTTNSSSTKSSTKSSSGTSSSSTRSSSSSIFSGMGNSGGMGGPPGGM